MRAVRVFRWFQIDSRKSIDEVQCSSPSINLLIDALVGYCIHHVVGQSYPLVPNLVNSIAKQ